MTTNQKQPSRAALLRKIARLESVVENLDRERRRAIDAYMPMLSELVDLRLRVQRAQAILNGDNE